MIFFILCKLNPATAPFTVFRLIRKFPHRRAELVRLKRVNQKWTSGVIRSALAAVTVHWRRLIGSEATNKSRRKIMAAFSDPWAKVNRKTHGPLPMTHLMNGCRSLNWSVAYIKERTASWSRGQLLDRWAVKQLPNDERCNRRVVFSCVRGRSRGPGGRRSGDGSRLQRRRTAGWQGTRFSPGLRTQTIWTIR